MYLSALRVFFEIRLFLLTLISSVYLGQTCTMSSSVTESAGNASILQGSNHTFWCKGNGSNIVWDINGTAIHNTYPGHSKLKVVDLENPTQNGCVRESTMTVRAKNSSGSNAMTVFTIKCTLLSDSFPFIGPSEMEYLNVYVIGEVRDFELIPPVTSSKPALMQWKAPYVFSGSSSPLHYNITVRDSTQVIAQSTTMDTSYTINSDLLVPCDSYLLTVLPFQQMPTHIELGMMMQTVKNYSGILLPATDIQSSVSVDSIAANATIHFQANFASCHLQWSEKFIVAWVQGGRNENDKFQSTEQIVQEGMNKYKLENLDLRKKYQVSVKMENKYSSIDSEFFSISTFEVQKLSLEPVTDNNQLNVKCVMANGAQNKHCKVEIRSETGNIQRNCTKIDGASASCVLRGLPLGEYLVWGYDDGYNDSPAVTVVFNVTEEPNEDSTDTTPTRDIATSESSPSRVGVEEAVQIVLPLGISVALVLAIAIIVFVSIIVTWRSKCYSTEKQNTSSGGNPSDSNIPETRELDLEAPRDELLVYKMADENEYHEGPLPLPEPAPLSNEHGLPSQHMLQEPAYAQLQNHTVIATIATAGETSTGYKQHRKEWLVPRHSEGLTPPHTQDLDNTPEISSL